MRKKITKMVDYFEISCDYCSNKEPEAYIFHCDICGKDFCRKCGNDFYSYNQEYKICICNKCYKKIMGKKEQEA